MLRRGTGVEALHGAEAVGSLELGATLNAVHRCAAEAGALLGPLAGEACLALMAAGGAVGGGEKVERAARAGVWARGPTWVRMTDAGSLPGTAGLSLEWIRYGPFRFSLCCEAEPG